MRNKQLEKRQWTVLFERSYNKILVLTKISSLTHSMNVYWVSITICPFKIWLLHFGWELHFFFLKASVSTGIHNILVKPQAIHYSNKLPPVLQDKPYTKQGFSILGKSNMQKVLPNQTNLSKAFAGRGLSYLIHLHTTPNSFGTDST